jgi:chromosome partitioning protein
MDNKAHTPYIIVVGNEKGGVGKTTIAMHIITTLLYDGFSVASMDIDSRQRSLSNYLENRAASISAKEILMPMPSHSVVNRSKLDSARAGEMDEENRFTDALGHACGKSDVVVIDAPGNDTFLSRLAHSYADTIVTPINDSFVDLNVLAKTDDETFLMNRHGLYSEVVWQAKMQKAQRSGEGIDWIILRNRLSHVDAHNKRNMLVALENFSKRSGVKLAEGLSERVIYKELFLKGMTLLDIIGDGSDINITVSHVAARQELRKFIDCLGIHANISSRKQSRIASEQIQPEDSGAPEKQEEAAIA